MLTARLSICGAQERPAMAWQRNLYHKLSTRNFFLVAMAKCLVGSLAVLTANVISLAKHGRSLTLQDI